jgi:GT2 family glycosyltransferase
MPLASPTLGVVIPCHNNARQLYGVLLSLVHQSARPEAVVAVDDDSDPWHERRLRAVCRSFGVPYRKLPAPSHPLEALGRRSHARNAGTACLATDLVLYLDGDMLLAPGYVEEIKHYHRILPDVFMRAQRFSIPAAIQAGGMALCLDAISSRRTSAGWAPAEYATCAEGTAWPHVYHRAYRDKWVWCASNNLSVRRDVVGQIGYWDENFVGWGEEDMDFAFRLHNSGLTSIMVISSAAQAYHLDHHIDHERNALTLRRNAAYLLAKSPGIAPYRLEAYERYGISSRELR